MFGGTSRAFSDLDWFESNIDSMMGDWRTVSLKTCIDTLTRELRGH
jgi:hypothetical protein